MYSFYSTVGEILSHPEAARIMEELIPGATTSEKLELGWNFSLERLSQTPGGDFPEYMLQELVRRLNEQLYPQ